MLYFCLPLCRLLRYGCAADSSRLPRALTWVMCSASRRLTLSQAAPHASLITTTVVWQRSGWISGRISTITLTQVQTISSLTACLLQRTRINRYPLTLRMFSLATPVFLDPYVHNFTSNYFKSLLMNHKHKGGSLEQLVFLLALYVIFFWLTGCFWASFFCSVELEIDFVWRGTALCYSMCIFKH